ncbi:sugar-binding domain-containing protein [Pelagicoccus sp. SDUM812002]|uniref:sugar-binding domain-containing protein n=1 Tax=Pelagicoccus sp. SDUM812002 TaxID=3041266 RepID=UPI0028104189|nr:sugar-binding domain-containing protein [Pelagicoccus sp. SDUM812002]MDQ8184209.1 hypothetical protein [Pelagicoccus sp. SDUM812002]
MKLFPKRSFALILSLVTLNCNSSKANGIHHEWENPEIFQIYREAPHAFFTRYQIPEAATKDRKEESRKIFSLNGNWSFNWAAKPSERPIGFENPNFDASSWDQISVPSHWELQGFGIPIYTNIINPFPKTPRSIDHSDNPVGSYRHKYTIPSEWNGQRVYLCFGGVSGAMYVWVNGQRIEYSEGSKSEAEFDITDSLQTGDRLLAVEIYRWSDASYMEDQEFWRLNGIERDVWLYATNTATLTDLTIIADLDDSFSTSKFVTEFEIVNTEDKTQTISISAKLLDGNKKILEFDKSLCVPANGNKTVTFDGDISNVRKWTAETPELYSLEVVTKPKNGESEFSRFDVGFRRIEIKSAQLLVNGKEDYLKGVNLHDHHPLKVT